jgi:hypothetical protein
MGIFYLYYVTQHVAGVGYLIWMPDILLYRRVKASNAYTERAKLKAWATVPFAIDWFTSHYMALVLIALAYSCIVPFITVPAAIALNLRYFTDKYCICCFFSFDLETRGKIPTYNVYFFFVAITVFQCLTGCMLMSFDVDNLVFLGSAIITASLLIFLGAICCRRRIFYNLDRIYANEEVDYAKAREMYSFPKVDPEYEKVAGESPDAVTPKGN